MSLFVDLNNNIMPTDMLPSQVFGSTFGKLIVMILLLAILVIATAIGTIILLLIDCAFYVWGQLTPGYEFLELTMVLSSIGSFVMFGFFFYELSKTIDRQIELSEKRNKQLKEENEALRLVIGETNKQLDPELDEKKNN
jgi:hypothetical protein